MNELVGKDCAVVFVGDFLKWPHPFNGGYPARVVVLDVAMPMLKLACFWGDRTHGVWINVGQIATIRDDGSRDD